MKAANMSEVTIRSIKKEDNAPLAAIIRGVIEEFGAPRQGTVYSDASTDDLYTLFQAPGSELKVVEVRGEPAGCGGIYPTAGLPEGCCEFVKFYLAAPARGKGTGRQLLEQCLAAARALGYTQVYLESIPEFSTAVGLYRKLGFEPLPGPMGDSGHFSCDIWMLKQL
ncbi:GNAT family N-acetyltransferase [Paraflavisolibacter sp. H34]|uniref:GNAT family N-acetyltransferase n=1 Tax=Huijunlia imazamoxiresistens TaxID=3127457 RepID=UPI003017AC64